MGSSLKKSSIFDVIRPLPRRPIKPAGSKYGTVANTTLEDSGIELRTLRNHIPCMVHVVQLALGAFMSSPSAKGRTNDWEAHEHDQQLGKNQSTVIGKSKRLRNEGNARINQALAMRPGLAQIIEKVGISSNFERPRTDLHIAANPCCIDYTDTWWLKRNHCQSIRRSTNCSTTYYGCDISNDPSFCQKHPGVLDGSDSSDGTSYPLTVNYTLPVAQAMGHVAYLPPSPFGEVYAPSERRMCYTLRRGCSYAVAIHTKPGDVNAFLRPIATCHTLIYVSL